MKRIFWLFLLICSEAYGQASYARQDFYFQNARGQAISGASVYVLTQPANISSLTPLATIYGSSTGSGTANCRGSAGTITNPVMTDGFEHACAYATPGLYTVCYVSSQTGTNCYPDQNFFLGGNKRINPSTQYTIPCYSSGDVPIQGCGAVISDNVLSAPSGGFSGKLNGTATGNLPLTGETLTGPLALAGAPTSSLQATTKQYTDKATSLSMMNNGAHGDAIQLRDVVLSNGSTTLSSASASFVSTDAGKSFACVAGLSGYLSISSVTDSHDVVLASAATANESGLQCHYGHDDTVAFQNALQSTGSYPSTLANVFVPPGTYLVHSNTIAVRKGETLIGAGSTLSALVSYDSSNFMVQMGTNASGTSDPGGLVPVVENLYLQAPNASNGIMANANGFTIEHNWLQTNIGIQVQGTDGIVSENTCDQCGVFVIVVGTGTDYTSTHSMLITNNRTYAPKYACFEIQGAYDLIIDDNYCNYPYQFGLYFNNASYTSYRVKITNNQFSSSTSSSYYSPTEQHIYIAAPVYGLQIANNTFARGISADIYNASNVFEGQINDNVFEDSQAPNGSIQIQSSRWTVIGNAFINGNSWAINDVGGVIAAHGNIFSGIFSGGNPSNPRDNAAIHLTTAANAGSVISGNMSADTTYYILGQSGGAVNTTSFGNLSGFSSGDVYDEGNGPFNSCNERTTAPSAVLASTCTANVLALNSGQSWRSGSGTPSGSCTSGSLYTNSAGAASTTLYVCISSAWKAVAIP